MSTGSGGAVSQLRVGDESFLVTSMIDRCPKVMMLRELVRNALEAAATAPAGARQVRLSAVPIEGVRKLAIWNTGRGMNAEELFRMCDIASSIRKEHRLDQNFGMGAKVASLPSNRHGLRYRSCHDGIVNEVMLGYRDGVYGRLRQPGAGGALQDVVDATAAALAEGRDPSIDWTEVVLFGNAPDQDTMYDPYQNMPGMPPHWIAEELAYKFFRIEDGVEILLDEHRGVRFQPFAERMPRDYGRHEAVVLPDGVVLHYVHDPVSEADPGSSAAGRDALYPVHGACGLVHKDELYDVHRWHHWLHVAPIFGIPFAARRLSVFIELPEPYGIIPDGYRQFVRFAGGSQEQVGCRHFAEAIHRNRPRWLIDIIERQAPSARVSDRVYGDLDRLLRDLKVRRRPRMIPLASPVRAGDEDGPAGAAEADEPPGGAGEETGSGPAEHRPDGEPVEDAIEYEPPPEILVLREPAEIEARGLQHWAARYYPETHQLFLNGRYPAVVAMTGQLQTEFAWRPDQERVREQAMQLAEQAMAARVGRMLVFSLSKQGTWHDHDVHHSSSVQALSVIADDYASSMPAARDVLRGAA